MGKPTLDGLRAQLREHGLRATGSRLAVLALLHASDRPVSHPEACARLARSPFDAATLYRNLVDFAEVGLVTRLDMGDHVWRFVLARKEHDGGEHPHFVCTGCNAVQCLPQMRVRTVGAKAPRSIRLRQVEIQVRGLCDACA